MNVSCTGTTSHYTTAVCGDWYHTYHPAFTERTSTGLTGLELGTVLYGYNESDFQQGRAAGWS